MCKPDFTEPLKDLEVNDGEALTLQCSVNGDPEPQITWSKNGKAISSSEIMNLKYKNGIATLTINEVYPEDEGVYTCTATNSIGATDTKCNLKIKRKPIILFTRKTNNLNDQFDFSFYLQPSKMEI